jgi:pyruvate dehydrogenase E1 component alpha subunit/2-oxoisovalerate dehydrogenase E1 component alpha subunit
MDDATRDRKLELYRWMRLNRTVEEKLVNLYRQGKVVGGLYRSLGQEAASVGTASALERGDVLGPLIRNLGSVLVMGYTTGEVFASFLARESSPSRGREGIHHFGRPERGVVSPISMLGSLIPVMAGVALAGRMQGRRLVAMTYIGDGGSSTGPFHEGLNFAAVMKLPVVVVAENNGWAYSTPIRRQMAAASLAGRAAAYGISAETVDGNDVEAVYAAARRAVDRARAGHGPTLLETLTYRMKGHAEHDHQSYVPAEELAAWGQRDPITLFARRVVEQGAATQGELDAIDASVAAEVEREADLAERSPLPDPHTVSEGVYAGSGAPSEIAILRRRA